MWNLTNRKSRFFSNPDPANLIICSLLFGFVACSQEPAKSDSSSKKETKYNKLTPQEESVLIGKNTDRAFTGDYYQLTDKGVYICKQCNNPLYRSDDKFESHCGWPSFDDEIEGSVIKVPDADGMRTEIICSNCKGHLGHVFTGEGFTDKDTRHCVNTSSIQFYPSKDVAKIPKVIK
jgi:methionine-R-sulfoxide reductase